MPTAKLKKGSGRIRSLLEKSKVDEVPGPLAESIASDPYSGLSDTSRNTAEEKGLNQLMSNDDPEPRLLLKPWNQADFLTIDGQELPGQKLRRFFGLASG
jgi:hypothetical protein